MKWQSIELSAGDMIRVRIGKIYHYAIYISDDEIIQFGEPPRESLVYRDISSITVCVTDINGFSNGDKVEKAVLDSFEEKIRKPVDKVISDARCRVGEGGYNIIHNNCEHFVYECFFGKMLSTQEDCLRNMWKSRDILNIYISEIGDDISELRCNERNEYINSIGNVESKKRSYYVWKLLETAIAYTYGKEAEKYTFKRLDSGRWYSDNLFFSLSHSHNTVAVAVSNKPVGIDIEDYIQFISKNPIDKVKRMMKKITNEEYEGDDIYNAFLSEWTKKESIFKKYDNNDVPMIRTDTKSESTLTGLIGIKPEIFISVCSENTAKAVIHQYADGKFTKINNLFTEYGNTYDEQ